MMNDESLRHLLEIGRDGLGRAQGVTGGQPEDRGDDRCHGDDRRRRSSCRRSG